MSSPALFERQLLGIHNTELREINIPLVEVDIGLLADQVGVSSTDTLDLSKSVHDLAATLNVGVKETQDVLQKFLSAPLAGKPSSHPIHRQAPSPTQVPTVTPSHIPRFPRSLLF